MTAASASARPSYLWCKLRRFGCLLVAAAVFFIGGHDLLQRILERRLTLAVRAVDEQEGHWRLDDLQQHREPIPVADNAAEAVQAVAAQLSDRIPQQFFAFRQSTRDGVTDYGSAAKALPNLTSRDNLAPDQAWLLRLALAREKSAVEQARRLADYSRGRYAIEHGPSSSTPPPERLGIRKVVFLLRHDALLSLHERRFADGLRACRAIVVAGRSVGDEPAPSYQLLRVECWDVALQLVDRVLAARQAPGEELRKLQEILEAEADEPLTLQVLRGDLAITHFRITALEAGGLKLFSSRGSPPVARFFDWLARDAVKFPHAGILDYLARRIAAARLPAEQQAAALKQLEKDRPQYATLGTAVAEWRCARVLKSIQIGQTRLRAAALALAATRYWARRGVWPEQLAAMVPEFLASVPRDPFAAAPMNYQRLPTGIVIYSVGRDGRDNGGRVELSPDAPGSDIGYLLPSSAPAK